jgi:hypothetical protein
MHAKQYRGRPLKKVILLLLLLASGPALAATCNLDREDLLTRPGREAGTTDVYIHTYINDIVTIRDADQSFSSDVFARIEWDDPRLAHAGDVPCSVGMGDVWWPELQFMNRRSVQQVREMRPLVAPDGRVSLLLRGFGEFSFKADLSDFPFDEQQLTFDILSIYSDDEIDFVYDLERIALAPDLSVANFSVELAGVEERSDYIASTQRQHARLLIKMRAERLTGFYTWQQLVPLFLVVLMAWIVFWIPREHVPSRIGLAATSMLTLIAYRFAMSSVLPPIAYLTRLDIFMIGASVLVFSALATAVAVTYVMDLVGETLAERIHVAARFIIPLLLAVISWLSFFA